MVIGYCQIFLPQQSNYICSFLKTNWRCMYRFMLSTWYAHQGKTTWHHMWQQVTNIVLRPLFDFIMDSFKVSKIHNMFVLMLDPQFKDLHLVGNYVGHFSTIKIAITYDS
jgi:hypothetical protein